MNRSELLAALELVRDLHSRIEKALEETASASNSDDQDEYVGTSEAEQISGISRTTLYRWAHKKAIKGGKTRDGNGPWSFSKASLLKARRIKSEC